MFCSMPQSSQPFQDQKYRHHKNGTSLHQHRCRDIQIRVGGIARPFHPAKRKRQKHQKHSDKIPQIPFFMCLRSVQKSDDRKHHENSDIRITERWDSHHQAGQKKHQLPLLLQSECRKDSQGKCQNQNDCNHRHAVIFHPAKQIFQSSRIIQLTANTHRSKFSCDCFHIGDHLFYVSKKTSKAQKRKEKGKQAINHQPDCFFISFFPHKQKPKYCRINLQPGCTCQRKKGQFPQNPVFRIFPQEKKHRKT